MYKWLLPEHIEDVLPRQAAYIESMRRRMLDHFRSHGYQLVMPPMLEYVDSLLTGTGRDMDLKTIKVVDQLSGRMMGIRADITPQVARIDAHLLNRAGVTRLCYCGTVMHALPSGILHTREPLQLGAEVYGHASLESDHEVLALMLDCLAIADIATPRVDIGHVAIVHSLVAAAELDDERRAALFQALQVKDKPEIRSLLQGVSGELSCAISALPGYYGDATMLDAAMKSLPELPGVMQALTDLRQTAARLVSLTPNLSFDLAEVRGYRYYSGMVFAAYADGWPNPVAMGGRYDHVGEAFGRARPAAGFSLDLRDLVDRLDVDDQPSAILAPYAPQDPLLQQAISNLRAAGEIVLVALPGHPETPEEWACDRVLAHTPQGWAVKN